MADKLQLAWEMFSKAHEGQFRKDGTTPYIIHPIRVCQAAKYYGMTEDLQIVALGHDVLEDTDISAKAIEDAFGRDILAGIWWLTNPGHRDSLMDCSRAFKKTLMNAKLYHACADIQRIKLFDRYDNLTCLEKGKLSDTYFAETRALLDVVRKNCEHESVFKAIQSIVNVG